MPNKYAVLTVKDAKNIHKALAKIEQANRTIGAILAVAGLEQAVPTEPKAKKAGRPRKARAAQAATAKPSADPLTA